MHRKKAEKMTILWPIKKKLVDFRKKYEFGILGPSPIDEQLKKKYVFSTPQFSPFDTWTGRWLGLRPKVVLSKKSTPFLEGGGREVDKQWIQTRETGPDSWVVPPENSPNWGSLHKKSQWVLILKARSAPGRFPVGRLGDLDNVSGGRACDLLGEG